MMNTSQLRNSILFTSGVLGVLCLAGSLQAQLTITNLGSTDPSSIFLDGVPVDPNNIDSSKRINEGDDTGAAVSRDRGQVFFTPDTGDANSGWSLTDITVRWDDNAAEYPTADFQVRLTVYPWQDLGNPDASNVDFLGGPTELPLQPIFTDVGALPALTPGVDLFDGDRLQLSLNSALELRENTAYGFVVGFDRNDGTALRIDDDSFRLESASDGSLTAGNSLAINFDYDPNGTGFSLLNSTFGDDIIFQLSGSSANIADNSFASLEVDRDTGNLSWKTSLAALADLDITGYSITTTAGRVLSGDSDWLSFADSDPNWQENGTISGTELSETYIGGAGSEQLAQSTTIDLGNAWEQSPFEDLVMTVDTAGGDTLTVPIRYVSSLGSTEALVIGDYNLSGDIDIGDWPTVRDNLLSDVSAMDNFGRYSSGDLNFDGLVNSTDFLLFRNLFEAATGGSLEAALASVPEPSTLYLLLGVCIVVFSTSRFRPHLQQRVLSVKLSPSATTHLSILVLSMLTFPLSCGSSAQAVVIADFNSSVAGTDPNSIDADNLDLGTVGGTWTVNQAAGAQSEGGGRQGKVEAYTDAPSDLQFQLDGPRLADRSIPFDYRLDLTSSVALNGTNTLSFDASGRRAGGVEAGRRDGLIRGLDATGDVLFELLIDGINATFGTIGLVGQSASAEAINTTTAGSTVATTDFTSIDISLGASNFDVIVGGNIAYSGIGYTSTVTDLSEIQFTGSGPDAGFAGYSIDNIEVIDLAAERIALNVNTANGAVSLTSPLSQDLISYTIAGTGLDFDNGWTSLEETSFDDSGWEEAGGSSATALGEVRLQGSSTFDTSTLAALGTIYDEVADAQDLSISYILDNQTTLTGVVNYFAGDTADYDADGDVDGDDLALWEANYGQNAGADSDNNFRTDGLDFLAWQRQLGNGTGALTPTATAVPEPNSVLMMSMVSVLLTARRAKRRVCEL